MRNKLIEIMQNWGTENTDSFPVESVADYLLANGVIVPPCKTGCEVWFCDQNNIYDGELVSFSLDAAHLWFNCRYKCGLNYWHIIEDFGTKVFLTKEQAERKLREVGE